MRSDELAARVRLNCTLEDGAPDYPDAIVLNELNDSLKSTFSRMIVAARAGYWAQQYDVTVVTPQPKYRIPQRAVGGSLEKVMLGVGSPPVFNRLQEVSEAHAAQFEQVASVLGQPVAYVVRGDQVVLLPNPDATAYTLRMHYYVRPSRLVTQQSVAVTGFTERGRVTAVNVAARTITVNVVPFDMEAINLGVVTPTAITSANQLIDVVHPNGWYELALVGAAQTLAGSVFTVGGTDDMNEIAVGDYVRAAEQTDWPCLPEDFHRALADTASVKILAERDFPDKAGSFAQAVTADIGRMQDLLLPRVKSEALTIKAPLPMLRGRTRWPLGWYT